MTVKPPGFYTTTEIRRVILCYAAHTFDSQPRISLSLQAWEVAYKIRNSKSTSDLHRWPGHSALQYGLIQQRIRYV